MTTAPQLLTGLTAAGATLEAIDGRIRVTGRPLNPGVRDLIRQHRDNLLALIEDRCRRCRSTRYVTAYWGEPLCRTHAVAVARQHDLAGTWPAVDDDNARTPASPTADGGQPAEARALELEVAS